MDFLDDPFSEPKAAKAPVAGRFQPKAKPRLKKVPAAAVKATKEPTVTSVPQDSGLNQYSQPNILVEKKSEAPNTASFTSIESLGVSVEDGNLSAKAKEVAGSAVVEHSETAVSGPSITTDGRNAETENPDVSVIQSEEEQTVFPNVSFASASPLRPCNSQIAPDQSVDKILEDSECYEEPVVCGDGDFHIDVEQLGAGDFSCLDNMEMMSEGASASEKRAVKLLPKPKAQGDRQKDSAEADSHLPDALEIPSESQHVTIYGSLHAGEPGTVSDALNISLDGRFSIDPPLYQPHTVVSDDTDSLMPEDLPHQSGEYHGERRSYDVLNSAVKSVDEGFLPGLKGNENGHELDGMNDTFHDNSSSYGKEPDEFAPNRAENIDSDHLGEEISQKKKPRKSKKEASENDKPTRKRKKAAQKPGESTENPPKKFPHGTRRKRCVDKSLLEIPEDELDLQRVPIKDLILLAEYKERVAKKEAATVLPPPTNERFDSMSDIPYDDNGTFDFDQYGNAFDNPSTSGIHKDTGYFNYQSFMTKEPRARWTKQDTELFYKGISQFGSDLSMIQQLFPGRTRHQIKLKYKKEERQNPMRLHDALTSRSQDHSHFELVIERLQEQAARDAKTDKDDSVCPTGDDEGPEEVLNTHEDVAESKKKEGQVADQEPDRSQAQSPPKSYISEEEEFDWSEYKSEL